MEEPSGLSREDSTVSRLNRATPVHIVVLGAMAAMVVLNLVAFGACAAL